MAQIGLEFLTVQANAPSLAQSDTRLKFEAGSGAFISFGDPGVGNAVATLYNVHVLAAGRCPPINGRGLSIVSAELMVN
jgi:hypothetical protein